MPDDNILQVGAQVTIGEFKAGMDQAVASTRAAGGEMSAAFQALAAESQAATTEISSAWVRAAESSVAFAKAKDQVRAASRAAKQAEDDDGAALANLAVAQQRVAVAAEELAVAQKAASGATEQLGEAAAHTGAQMAYSSAAIRVFEGALPIRAVERFLSETLGLGPILSRLFPYIGAIAFGEMLAEIVQKVIEWKEGLKEIEQWNETIGATIQQQTREMEELAKHTCDTQVEIVGIVSGKGAEDLARAGILSRAIETDKQNITSLEAQLRNVQQRMAPVQTIRGRPDTFKAAAEQKEHLKDLQGELQQVVSSLALARAKLTDDTTSLARDQAAASKEAAREAEEAARKQVEALRKADTDAMEQLKLRAEQEGVTGQALLERERSLLEQRLAAESQYTERVRELRSELDRVTIEGLAQFDRVQKLVAEGLQQEVDKAKLEGALQGEEQQLEMQKAQQERQAALSGPSITPSGGGEVESLREQQAIEERILALKVEQARIDAEAETESISQNFTKGINQWIEGQKKFGQAMAQSWNSIVMTVVESLEKMLVQQIAYMAQSQSLSLSAALQQQFAAAKVAAANTWAAVSAIPIIGPILAPPAAAAAFAAVLAFEQGGLVPATGLAMLHANEMVLPSALSQHVMDTAGGGGGTRGGASSVHVHYSPTINGSGSDLKSMLSAHADHIGRIAQRQMRVGKLSVNA